MSGHTDGAEILARDKPRLATLPDHALNAESRPDLLDEPLTPVSHFFVRNNGGCPSIGAEALAGWTLGVEGEVERARRWTLDDLRRDFETVTVTAVLECAGNGRTGFSPATPGLQFTEGGVGCARWTGYRLADLLAACGIGARAAYTAHYSPDRALDWDGSPMEGPAISRGLPIAKALAPETLLAFAMNGEPLSYLHGAPLRIVAPGFPGSAWQKWLERIVLRDCVHDGPRMRGTDYRLPRRPLTPGCKVDPAEFEVITDMPVKSLITAPAAGSALPREKPIALRGFGWSGHVPLASVAVSADGGETWSEADLEPAGEPFAWRRFSAALPWPASGEAVLVARATDAAGTRQPLGSAVWNPRGYCNNGVHRVPVAPA